MQACLHVGQLRQQRLRQPGRRSCVRGFWGAVGSDRPLCCSLVTMELTGLSRLALSIKPLHWRGDQGHPQACMHACPPLDHRFIIIPTVPRHSNAAGQDSPEHGAGPGGDCDQ